jgi:predicted nucleotide-binding protein
MQNLNQMILIIEDDFMNADWLSSLISRAGYETIIAVDASDALRNLKMHKEQINLIILDIMLPIGDQNVDFDLSKISDTKYTGTYLFRHIRELCPDKPVIIRSSRIDEIDREFFIKQKQAFFLSKDAKKEIILYEISTILEGQNDLRRSIIIHGKDEITKFELINLIQNKLNLAEPIILHEEHSFGKKIIKNIDYYDEKINYVFIILPPENETYDQKNQFISRENIIFETAFLAGKLINHGCHIILLYKDNPNIPIEIDGLIKIDISKGLKESTNNILKEIQNL